MRVSFSKGMGILELVIVLGIVTLIVIGLTTFFKDSFTLNRHLTDILSTSGEARRALRTMTSEMRTTLPSSLGAYPLVVTATSTFTFYSNIDNDGGVERVRYFVASGTLRRGIVEATGSPITYNVASETITDLVHGIQNTSSTPLFSYYDTNYAGTTSPLVSPFSLSVVRMVKVDIRTAQATSTAGVETFTTQVMFRNLKDNL